MAAEIPNVTPDVLIIVRGLKNIQYFFIRLDITTCRIYTYILTYSGRIPATVMSHATTGSPKIKIIKLTTKSTITTQKTN